MNMRKVLALLLAVVMVCGMLASCGGITEENPTAAPTADNTNNDNQATEPTQAPDEPTQEITWANQVIGGTTTDTTGDIKAYWENGAADATVNDLTTGYGTVETAYQDAHYEVNMTAVDSYVLGQLTADGTKVMTYNMKQDLVWSNGEPITAKDYVRGLLLFSSPFIVADNAYGTAGNQFVGWEDFNQGTTPVFAGVHLLGDYSFSVELSSDYLPNFFELAYYGVVPEYKAWLPDNYDIADDGEGAYFTKDGAQITLDASYFDELDPIVQDWRFNMDVFSGQYVRTEYDAAGLAYTCKINPLYKGNWEGRKSAIETIIYKKVQQETMMDELRTGAVDLIDKATDGSEITTGLNMYDEGIVKYTQYDRNGYGFFGFKCSVGPAQFKEVRHACAYLLDRNDFATAFTGGFGGVVHGPYGQGMWMTKDGADMLAERLNTYNYNVDNAIASLVEGGWTLDAEGNEYTSGLRYKEVTAAEAGEYPDCVTLADGRILMPLRLQWCSSEGNSVSDLLVTKLAQGVGVSEAGMEIKQTVMTFAELLSHYNDPRETYYCCYNLATNFSTVYDQSEATRPGAPSNVLCINDPELYELAKDMLRVESSDPETFLEMWVDFIDEWNDYLPALPLYSNEYYDFFTPHLNYKVCTDYVGFSGAIIYATVEGYEDFNQ